MPSIYLTFFSLINYISVQMKLLIAAILLFCSLQIYSQQYWLEVSSPVTKTLNKSFFLDTINGWAIGDSGVIIHTSNGGINWAKQSSGISTFPMDDIFFINPLQGWALANDFFFTGTVMLKTTDGGQNWSSSRYPDSTVVWNTIHFMNAQTGFLSGYSGLIMKTTNGGVNWFNCFIDTAYCPYLYLFPKNKFYFVNSNTGYVCGGQIDIQGMVWKTTNAGANWYTYCVSAEPLYDIVALSENKIVSAGGDYEYGFSNVISLNGGNTWSYEWTGIIGRGQSVAFRTPAEVWVPLNFTTAFAVNTDSANIGTTWREIPITGTSKINSTVFVTPTFGWSFGGEGKIYKYNTAVIGLNGENEIVPEIFTVQQNYPNPFNPVTTVNFTLNRSGLVKAEIFDAAGKKVYTMLNSYQQAGFHSAEWNASDLPSGVYFLKMDMLNSSKTIKMLLVK